MDQSHLVIAPPGNPPIRLDARLLDSIELIGRSPRSAYAMGAMAIGGVVAGALSWIPGGPFVAAGMAYLARERIVEGRRRQQSRDLLLVLGGLEVALHVGDGPEAAKRVADQLSQYTRNAPITRPEVYEDARRRLAEHSRGSAKDREEAQRGLKVGEEAVRVHDDQLVVGSVSFPIEEVRSYALRGNNLPLPDGRLLQAAMGLLVVAAHERAQKGEDVEGLSARIAEYEKWTGRHAGR